MPIIVNPVDVAKVQTYISVMSQSLSAAPKRDTGRVLTGYIVASNRDFNHIANIAGPPSWDSRLIPYLTAVKKAAVDNKKLTDNP
ncbi:hypothetical protein [Shewanella algidipiscicola]|uniref:hypothetical protein n=1 Tax=Shewanella algidipiscicola TaxID=614070 RepID=UPI0013A585AA|nr:hypothetical protein [Shewanella algidipiscicola]